MITLSVIVPLFNERQSIPELLSELSLALHDRELQELVTHPFSHEIIMVDDGSTDGSADVVKSLTATTPGLKLISFQKNFGKTAALSAGFRAAEGEFVCTIDADLQDDPASIKPLLRKLLEGDDLVSGWKRHRRDPLSKIIPSKLFNTVTRLFTGLRIHDINCGLKVYRSSLSASLELHGDMHRYIPVLAAWRGFKVSEVAVSHRPRKFGTTKYGAGRFLSGLFDFLAVLFITRYFRRPIHFFGMAGLISFLAGFGISLYVTLDKIINSHYISNRPILFLGILLLILGVQLFSTGLLGEMLSISAPTESRFAIKETENLTNQQKQNINS
ncbi:MAG: glycosyltransferase family 2 protein [Candidatus Chlorobium antarcticum]|nr:glycosyltransferase family 2 protein [Candidatus Chlorobium antarcticum]